MKYLSYLAGAAMAAGFCGTAPAAFVINELDSDDGGTDNVEFIEVKGNAGEAGTSAVLVLYNGAVTPPTVYRTIDLSGATADADGYILIGDPDVDGTDITLSPGFIQNGEDAVALFHPADPSFFPNGTAAETSDTLKDVVVYRAGATQAAGDWSAFGSPTPAQEYGAGAGTVHGVARIPDGTGAFKTATRTPRAVNADKTFTLGIDLFFPRFNQATAAVETTRTVTLRNNGPEPLAISSFGLDGTSSAAYSTVSAADPAPPVTLQYDQETTLVVQFQESDVSANKTYTGAVSCTTDSPTSPTGSVDLSTELVRSVQTVNVGDVMINEIHYQAGGTDHNGDGSTTNQNDEFVELVNMTASPIMIEGWEQRASDAGSDRFHSFVFPAGATIPANGFVTVFTAGNPTGFAAGTTFTYGSPRLNNGGSLVGISDATKLVDAVAYETGEDTPDADGYTNMGVLNSGNDDSIGRRPDGSSTFIVFSNADVVAENRPTPNASNNGPTAVGDWALYE